jgi:hypothetical protein
LVSLKNARSRPDTGSPGCRINVVKRIVEVVATVQSAVLQKQRAYCGVPSEGAKQRWGSGAGVKSVHLAIIVVGEEKRARIRR